MFPPFKWSITVGNLFVHRAQCRTLAPCAMIGRTRVRPHMPEDIFVLRITQARGAGGLFHNYFPRILYLLPNTKDLRCKKLLNLQVQ